MTGKVLWFDELSGNGIIEDAEGNEYYVSYLAAPAGLESGQVVEFRRCNNITQVYCAIIVKVIA